MLESKMQSVTVFALKLFGLPREMINKSIK